MMNPNLNNASYSSRFLTQLVIVSILVSTSFNIWLLLRDSHKTSGQTGFKSGCRNQIVSLKHRTSLLHPISQSYSEPASADSMRTLTANQNAELGGADEFLANQDADDIIVDAVVTYVNGEEPRFKKEFERYKNQSNIEYSVAKSRFQDHDDLRVLLRSLDVYGKMFRNVFLVVGSSSQVPSWINQKCSRLKIVYHKDIWRNPSHLPVFNSLAIEANLHHIDGLSETFVYFNDDLSLINEVTPEDWFWDLRSPIRKRVAVLYRADNLKLPKQVTKTGTDSHWLGPAIVTRTITNDQCTNPKRPNPSLAFAKLPKHTPHVLMRSVLEEAENDPKLAPLFARTSGSRFRSGKELNTVMLFYAYAECVRNMSIVLGDQNEVAYLGVNQGLEENAKQKYLNTLNFYAHGIREGWRKFICFNDVTDLREITEDGLEAAAAAYKWRAAYFPDKSSFEN